jgi:Mycolic acid cyclopropane synthetase
MSYQTLLAAIVLMGLALSGIRSLADAEERALAQTTAHADIHDGQTILELGCGWGSLSLWLAERYRNSLTGWRTSIATPIRSPILRAVYGADATAWRKRWRLFFLATAGLFGYRGGAEWGVSLYRSFRRVNALATH